MDAPSRVAVRPLERSAVSVVESDVGHELATKIGGGSEHATTDEIPLDLREPDLDLVQPGAVGRCVVDRDQGVLLEPRPHGLGFMGREIVTDDVDFAGLRLRGDDPIEEREEGLAGVPLGGHPFDVARVDLQRGVQ